MAQIVVLIANCHAMQLETTEWMFMHCPWAVEEILSLPTTAMTAISKQIGQSKVSLRSDRVALTWPAGVINGLFQLNLQLDNLFPIAQLSLLLDFPVQLHERVIPETSCTWATTTCQGMSSANRIANAICRNPSEGRQMWYGAFCRYLRYHPIKCCAA